MIETVPFTEAVSSRGSGSKGLPQSEWTSDGRYPVIGQGAEYVEGRSNREDLLVNPRPAVVLYGGHTRRAKLVTSPFIPGPNVKILTPGPKIDPAYLYRFLEQLKVESRGYADHFPEVKRTKIPLPPLAQQKRIASILDAADALRAHRREAFAQLDSLLKSVFLDMFGDPVANPKGWKEVPFGEIAADTRIGLVRSSKEFGWDFKVPYVRMDAVSADGDFRPERVQFTEANELELQTFSLRTGDFLFNTRNSKELVGKVCVFPGPDGWLFNNNLMRVRFRAEVEPLVIAMQFRFSRVQKELEKRKSGTTSVFAVYWKSLRTLPVLVPPAGLQQRFAAITHSVNQQKRSQRAHLTELDTLFASLQSRAFRGEL